MSETNQSTEVQSTQPLLSGNAGADIAKFAKNAPVSTEFDKRQSGEHARRVEEATERLASDKYVAAIQEHKPFNLSEVLGSVSYPTPQDNLPGKIHERAATIENRVHGTAVTPNEPSRQTNGGETQLNTLENITDSFKKTAATGAPISQEQFKSASCAAEKHNLTSNDVANFAAINNVAIPKDVVASLAGVKGSACGTEAKTPPSTPEQQTAAVGAQR